MRKGPSRKEQGFIWLGNYRYTRKNKITDKYRLYSGYYSSVAENRTTGLEVVRGDEWPYTIIEFNSVQQIKDYLSH